MPKAFEAAHGGAEFRHQTSKNETELSHARLRRERLKRRGESERREKREERGEQKYLF